MNADTTAQAPEPAAGDDVLLRVENLVKYFPVQSSALFRRDREFERVRVALSAVARLPARFGVERIAQERTDDTGSAGAMAAVLLDAAHARERNFT